MKVALDRQLMVMLESHVGTLTEVTNGVAVAGINILALCAYEFNNKVAIMFVTSDNNAAKHILEQNGYEVAEEEVLLLSLDNKPGALQHVTDKIAGSGINLHLMYGSVDQNAAGSTIVMISDNNLDVMMLIKTELERL